MIEKNVMTWRNESFVVAALGLGLFVVSVTATYRANGQDKTSPFPSAVPPQVILINPPRRPDQTAEQFAESRADQREKMFGFKNSVSGTVRYADGKPAKGFRVAATFAQHRSLTPGEGFAITDGAGHYTIRAVSDWAFKISVENEGKPFLARVQAQQVTLNPENRKVDNVDFVLDAGPGITIRVRDAETGKPIAGLPVKANRGEWYSPEPLAVTDAKGEFVYHSPLRHNELRIEPAPGASLDAAPGSSFYYNQTLKPGENVVWDVMVYKDPYSPKLVTLRGTVALEGGKPAVGMKVRLLRDPSCEQRDLQTITDKRGTFSFQTDRVTERSDKSGTLLLLEKDGETMVRFVRAADSWKPVRLKWQPSETVTVSGSVQDPDGHPLAGVPINYNAQFCNPEFRESDTSYELSQTGDNAGVTDENGGFTIKGLHPEAYYALEFGRAYQNGNPQGFGITHYPDPPYKGIFLHLKAKENRNIGMITVLPANGVVTGTLVDAAGNPVTKDVMVHVHGKHTIQIAHPESDGSFRVGGIPNEPLYLLVFYGKDGFYRTADDSPDLAVRIPVRAGDKNLKVVVPPSKGVKD